MKKRKGGQAMRRKRRCCRTDLSDDEVKNARFPFVETINKIFHNHSIHLISFIVLHVTASYS